MRILHTGELYAPSVGGAQEVIKQVSEHLAKRGHKVTVGTGKLAERTESVINGVDVEEFSLTGNAVVGFQGEVQRYQEFLLSGEFDLVMNYAAQQWATDLVFPILDQLRYCKILAPCGFSGLFNPEYASYFAEIPDIMRRYDHLVFHSNLYRDIEFARKRGLEHYTVIPNGASEEEFARINPSFRQRYGISEDTPLMLTVGSHTGLKGHALLMEAFRRARVGHAVLIIIGNAPSNRGCLTDCRRHTWLTRALSLGRKRVLLLDPPREEVVAAYHASDLFVFASKVECSPVVLFEAMASKTPFLTVACGNAQEIVNWSQGGIVIPTKQHSDGSVEANPIDMAHAIEELIKNPEERHRLREAGYRSWRDEFTWEKIAMRYERLYQTLVNGVPATHSPQEPGQGNRQIPKGE